MAVSRMVNKDFIAADLFRRMPISSRLLYFYLLIYADDDGFVDSPIRIMEEANASQLDYTILESNNLIIFFPTRICVVTDWHVHNNIPPSKYHKTRHQNEYKMLTYDEISKSYHFGLPRIDEDKIEEISIDIDDDASIIIEKGDIEEDDNTYIFNLFCNKFKKKYTFNAKNLTSVEKAVKKIGKRKLEKIIINESNRYQNGEYGSFFPNLTWVMGRGLDECVHRLEHPQKSSQNAGRLANDRDYDFDELEKELLEN